MTTAAPKPKPNGNSKEARRLAAAQQEVLDAQARLDAVEKEVLGPVGRPTLFRPEFVVRVTDLCMLGFTNQDLADHFNTSLKAIERWLSDVPEFRRAIWNGREGADAKVAAAMFKSATGYEHPEDDIRVVALGNNQGSEIVITPTTKRYAPNDRAASLWLANRQRARWKALGRDEENSDATSKALAARAAIAAAMAETEELPAADRSQPTED